MSEKPKHQTGVTINSNGSIKIGGDVVGGDKITYTSAPNQIGFEQTLIQWEKQMKDTVDKTDLSPDEKKDINNQVTTIRTAITQDGNKNPSRLEKLINTLAVMSSDIFDVAITTLANPLAGIGLTLRKISDKAKIERQSQ